MPNFCRIPSSGVIDYKDMSQIKRLPIGNVAKAAQVGHKEMHSVDVMQRLLSGTILIEEKMDGKPFYVRDNHLIVFGEEMKMRHSIHYTKLPSYRIVYDICDTKRSQWLSRTEKEQYCSMHGCTVAPKLYEGKAISPIEIERRFLTTPISSQFGDPSTSIEGIVIKNIDQSLFGKVIREEFMHGVELAPHWSRQQRSEKEKYNRMKK